MENPEHPRGFERAQETKSESYAEVANDYASEEQAAAAAQLVEVVARHKKIDVEIAVKAKAMLREMVDSGGDLDLEAVRGLVDEAERRYAVEDAITEETAPAPKRDDETQFFKVEPKRKEVAPVRELPKDPWEEWRAHLMAVGAMSADGDLLRRPEELGLDKTQADYISSLQRARYLSEGQYQDVNVPRSA